MPLGFLQSNWHRCFVCLAAAAVATLDAAPAVALTALPRPAPQTISAVSSDQAIEHWHAARFMPAQRPSLPVMVRRPPPVMAPRRAPMPSVQHARPPAVRHARAVPQTHVAAPRRAQPAPVARTAQPTTARQAEAKQKLQEASKTAEASRNSDAQRAAEAKKLADAQRLAEARKQADASRIGVAAKAGAVGLAGLAAGKMASAATAQPRTFMEKMGPTPPPTTAQTQPAPQNAVPAQPKQVSQAVIDLITIFVLMNNLDRESLIDRKTRKWRGLSDDKDASESGMYTARGEAVTKIREAKDARASRAARPPVPKPFDQQIIDDLLDDQAQEARRKAAQAAKADYDQKAADFQRKSAKLDAFEAQHAGDISDMARNFEKAVKAKAAADKAARDAAAQAEATTRQQNAVGAASSRDRQQAIDTLEKESKSLEKILGPVTTPVNIYDGLETQKARLDALREKLDQLPPLDPRRPDIEERLGKLAATAGKVGGIGGAVGGAVARGGLTRQAVEDAAK